MVLLVFVVLVLVVRYGLRHGWPGAVTVSAWWSHHREQVHDFVRRSPATFLYLAILTVTTWVLVGASSGVVDAMLREQSTNLSHLGSDPIRVLVRSAFWLSNYELLFWAVLYVVVLAPAERWLGTGRWLIAFAAGHVGATLLTATGVWLAIRGGIASHHLEDAVDVGVSYGFAAVAALFTYRLSGRWRPIWATGLIASHHLEDAVDRGLAGDPRRRPPGRACVAGRRTDRTTRELRSPALVRAPAYLPALKHWAPPAPA